MTCGNWFSPSIMWVLGIKPGLQLWQRVPSSVEAAGRFFVSKHILLINVYVYMKHKANI